MIEYVYGCVCVSYFRGCYIGSEVISQNIQEFTLKDKFWLVITIYVTVHQCTVPKLQINIHIRLTAYLFSSMHALHPAHTLAGCLTRSLALSRSHIHSLTCSHYLAHAVSFARSLDYRCPLRTRVSYPSSTSGGGIPAGYISRPGRDTGTRSRPAILPNAPTQWCQNAHASNTQPSWKGWRAQAQTAYRESRSLS